MTKLLFDERPLVISPSLAKKIGLNEALLLQQIHYWITNSDKVIDNKRWTYNTYDEWLKQFPFWSKSTLRRTIATLEKNGLLITDNHNKMKADKTKWYTIDYQKIEGLSSPCVQNEQSMCSDWTYGSVQNEQSNTLDFSEPSSKTSSKKHYAEFVTMTVQEHEELLKRFGEQGTIDRIENLNHYKGSKGKKYKSDYHTILNWERKNNPKKGEQENGSSVYDNLW